jgi:hypothetical protein
MQNTSVREISRRLNVLRSEKKHLKIDKNIAIFKVLIVANKKSDDEITSLEKRQLIYVLEGIKQGLKAHDQ